MHKNQYAMKQFIISILVLLAISCSNSKEYENRLPDAVRRVAKIEKYSTQIAEQTEIYIDSYLNGHGDDEISNVAKDLCIMISKDADDVIDSLEQDITFFKETKHEEGSLDDFINLYVEAKTYLNSVRTTKQKSLHDYNSESRMNREKLKADIERFKVKYIK
jgi:hypothetical protein